MLDAGLAELEFRVRRMADPANAAAALIAGFADLIDEVKTDPVKLHDLAVHLRRRAEDLAHAALAR